MKFLIRPGRANTLVKESWPISEAISERERYAWCGRPPKLRAMYVRPDEPTKASVGSSARLDNWLYGHAGERGARRQ